MQKVAELLAELETALVNVLQWLEAAAHGQPLTAEQEQAARRIISLTRWHPAEGKAIPLSGTRSAHGIGSAGNSAGNHAGKRQAPTREQGRRALPANSKETATKTGRKRKKPATGRASSNGMM